MGLAFPALAAFSQAYVSCRLLRTKVNFVLCPSTAQNLLFSLNSPSQVIASLIPGTCEYMTLNGIRDSVGVLK